jgi:hypothetical protein
MDDMEGPLGKPVVVDGRIILKGILEKLLVDRNQLVEDTYYVNTLMDFWVL